MSSSTASTTERPRFDVYLTAAGSRRDNWQQLHGIAQAWASAASSGRDGSKLCADAASLLSELEAIESYYAFPGAALIQKLREKCNAKDAIGFAELARRVSRAVLGG